MSEFKSMADLIIEAGVRRQRWRAFRNVVYVVCAVTATATLVWIAAGL